MIDMAMDNGDLIASDYGDILLHISDDDNIIQMANSAINTIRGENIFHLKFGNDAHNKRLKISPSGLDIVESCAKEAILYASNEIAEVLSVHAERGNEYGECVVSYTVLTSNNKSISSSTNINIL